MRETAQWVSWLSSTWKKERSSDPHPDFAKWLTDDERSTRTKHVMRKLRNKSVREYEVCYRVCVLGERLEQTAEWLSERAVRNDIPLPPYRPEGPHYSRKDAMALLMAGLAYAKQYW
jgi:hypothetical protein